MVTEFEAVELLSFFFLYFYANAKSVEGVERGCVYIYEIIIFVSFEADGTKTEEGGLLSPNFLGKIEGFF